MAAPGGCEKFASDPELAALGIGFQPFVPYVPVDTMERRHS